MPAVVLIQLGRSFGQTKAVDGVDLEIRDGEFLSLLGPRKVVVLPQPDPFACERRRDDAPDPTVRLLSRSTPSPSEALWAQGSPVAVITARYAERAAGATRPRLRLFVPCGWGAILVRNRSVTAGASGLLVRSHARQVIYLASTQEADRKRRIPGPSSLSLP
jgi:hypothetical protein